MTSPTDGPLNNPLTDHPQPGTLDTRFFGHPRGLSTLFFTEMWERFSYYGMRAFLILYMVHALQFDDKHAGSIYGTYTACAWAASIFGGIIADRWLGQYRSVLYGGIIIMLGHFSLALHPLPFFYMGLAFIVLGTGLLKPNVSGIVGSLYDTHDRRRDAGFSIFYMGINLGAMIGPLVAGYLAQRVDWHLGFACAGIGMAAGLTQYVLGRRHLQPAIERLENRRRANREAAAAAPKGSSTFTPGEWKQLGAMAVFFFFAAIFWAGYEQAGSSLSIFGDRYSQNVIAGFSFPSSWYQSVQPVFVILLAPAFAWLWVKLGRHEPSTPAKFALGLFFIGVSFAALLPAAARIQANPGVRVSPLWLVGCFFIQELAELCVSPVGLSVFTKLSPIKVAGMMLGVWFLADALGNKVAGYAAGFMAIPYTLFSIVAVSSLVAAVIAFFMIKPVRNLMGGVH
ncbi:MAG: peptide MFS transporter [Gemmatimonadota bacterium]